MASTSNACMLTDGGFLRISIYDPEPNIQEDHSGNYIDGQMDNESSPKGFYIVFDKKNYGIDDAASTRSVLVPENPLSGSSEKVTFGFTARSAHGFDVRSPGIVLFHLSTMLEMLRIIAHLTQILLMLFLGLLPVFHHLSSLEDMEVMGWQEL